MKPEFDTSCPVSHFTDVYFCIAVSRENALSCRWEQSARRHIAGPVSSSCNTSVVQTSSKRSS